MNSLWRHLCSLPFCFVDNPFHRGLRRSEMTWMIHPNVCFLILSICCWAVTASLMAEKTNVGVAVFVADNTYVCGCGSDGTTALLSACSLVRCCSHQFVFTCLEVLLQDTPPPCTISCKTLPGHSVDADSLHISCADIFISQVRAASGSPPQFTYLGSTITDNLSLDAEIDKRIGKAASTLARLTARVWTSPKLSVKTKMAVYNACVISTLLYGSETWTTYAGQERRLNSFHLRSIRRILGISWQDKVTNADVLSRAGLPRLHHH